jgi:hypothetical protein
MRHSATRRAKTAHAQAAWSSSGQTDDKGSR